jgi:uncharacterized membrane protein
MSYNIHPIFVHFPVALLFVYSVVKILPLQKWFPQIIWRDIERMLLVVGVLGAFASLATGETAQHILQPNRQITHMHSLFASAATWCYGLLLAGELLLVLIPIILPKMRMPKVTAWLVYIQTILTSTLVSTSLAFIGLVTLSVTGVLGGVLVYGTTADPIAGIVLKLLGIAY